LIVEIEHQDEAIRWLIKRLNLSHPHSSV
jgi:hypothetical protein